MTIKKQTKQTSKQKIEQTLKQNKTKQQNTPPTPHKRRQQCRRRHGTLRPRPGLPDPPLRRRRLRRRLRPLCRLRHHPAQRVPLAQDRHAGLHGPDGRSAAGMIASVLFMHAKGVDVGAGVSPSSSVSVSVPVVPVPVPVCVFCGLGCARKEKKRKEETQDGLQKPRKHTDTLYTR